MRVRWQQVGAGLSALLLLLPDSAAGVGIGVQQDSPLLPASGIPTTPDFSPAFQQCPQHIEPLMTRLIADLPSYINRVIQRTTLNKQAAPNTYVLIAGRPEYQPPLQRSQPFALNDPSLTQAFITTLERHYGLQRAFLIERYHWLVLTQTHRGWRLVTVFSQTRVDQPGQPPAPPQDANQGTLAQAVRLWLRDCEAGTLRNPLPQKS